MAKKVVFCQFKLPKPITEPEEFQLALPWTSSVLSQSLVPLLFQGEVKAYLPSPLEKDPELPSDLRSVPHWPMVFPPYHRSPTLLKNVLFMIYTRGNIMVRCPGWKQWGTNAWFQDWPSPFNFYRSIQVLLQSEEEEKGLWSEHSLELQQNPSPDDTKYGIQFLYFPTRISYFTWSRYSL